MSEAKIRLGGIAPKAKRQARGVESQIVADSAKRTKKQRGPSGQLLEVGARPRADLLPTEVLVDRRERAVVRRLWAGSLLVVVVVGLAGGVAALHAKTAADQLAAEQAQTITLTQQQGTYAEVQQLEASTSLLQAAQTVGGSTEIAWGEYLRTVQASLPEGVSVIGVTVDSAGPMKPYAQASVPLQGERVATLTFDAQSSTLPTVPDWLDALSKLPGYVDATANSVTLDSSTGQYRTNITMHVGAKAFDGKYTTKEK